MDCETMRDCVLGFVGLGNMGGPMCGRLLEKGYPVWAYDVDSRAIARLQETAAGHAERLHIATSLAELAHAAQVVLLSLPHSGIIEQVVLGERGLAHEMPNGSILIDLSSAKPSSTRRIANELGARGIAMLDAPVSGGVPRAREGTLAVMVGGEQSDFERCRPILAAISSAQFYIGPAGAGHLMKALNNLLSATTLASAVETLHLAERAGIDPALFVDVINASTGRSNSTQVKLPRYILPRTFADGFALGLMNKDVHIALEAADELGVPLAVGSVVAALWEEATAAGLGGEGHTSIYRFIEEWHAPSGVGEASSERTWPALTPTAEPGAAETDASGDLSGDLSAGGRGTREENYDGDREHPG